MLGTRDAVTEQTGASAVDESVRELRERTEQQIRTRLGEDGWARAYAGGRRASIDSLLRDAHVDAQRNEDADRRLRASLGLLPVDPTQVDYLHERLFQAQTKAKDCVVIRDALREHLQGKEAVTARLWALVQDASGEQEQRFRAACVLAAIAPADARWPKASVVWTRSAVVVAPRTTRRR